MDSLSDSSRCELDSVTSTDSLHLFADEFRLRHLISPDVTNAELSKRNAELELENERLRIDAENARIEADARNASNQGLKNKIAQLFIEAQRSLQEKLRLENALKDAEGRSVAIENSSKWYQAKLHESQANERARQTEIDAYQGILRQRQQSLADVTSSCNQFSRKYSELISKFEKEKRELLKEIERLKSKNESCTACNGSIERRKDRDLSPDLLEFKLETTTESSEEFHSRLREVEQRLKDSEISRNSAETALSKYRRLMSSMEENMERLEAVKNEISEKLSQTQMELKKLRLENEKLEISVLSSKKEQSQVEEGIIHLRSQLNKMIAQHRLIKSRNIEAERKLTSMKELEEENKRLKSLSYAANSSLFKKLKEEKRRVKYLEKELKKEKSTSRIREEKEKTLTSMRDCLGQALERNKELTERLKTKISNESIDEGYGDGSIMSSGSLDLPSLPQIDTVLIESAVDVLSRSKNFMDPVQSSLDDLRTKIDKILRGKDFENVAITSRYETRKLTAA